MLASWTVRIVSAIFSLAIVLNRPILADPLPDQAAVCRTIAEAAARTLERMESDAVAWEAVVELGNGGRAVVTVIRSPDATRRTLDFEVGGKDLRLIDLVERDDCWHVACGDERFKCRPYEAILQSPSVYHVLAMAELMIVTDVEHLNKSGELTAVEDGVAKFRFPVDAQQLPKLRETLAIFDAALPNVKPEQAARMKAQQAYLLDLIDHGELVEISLDHGLFLTLRKGGSKVSVERVSWPSGGDIPALGVGAIDWEDRTGGLLVDEAATRNDVIMISHAPDWRVGMPSQEPDVMLLNVLPGELRRLPFAKGICMPGCFSKDRSKAFVVGRDVTSGKTELIEIDLLTGENRELVSFDRWQGFAIAPLLSPDGKTLVICDAGVKISAPNDPQVEDIIASQITLVDVETGATKPLGAPMDVAFFNWLPDGSGLIFRRSIHQQDNKYGLKKIMRIDLDAAISELGQGDFPTLIRNGTRILYTGNARQWFTCDLTGGDPQIFGDGLKEYSFPAASPGGDRLVMMRFSKSTGPRPYLVDATTGEATPIPVDDGLWAIPAWQ